MITEKTYQTEEEWLKARQQYITATQVAKKTTQKLNIEQNPAIIWGKQREPIIIEENREYLENLGNIDYKPLRMFIIKQKNHAATPDAVIRKNNKLHACIEIKTAKHSLAWITKTKQTQTLQNPSYYDQIQWQLYCTNTQICHLIIETHLNYTPIEHLILKIKKDPKRIQKLQEIAKILQNHNQTLNTEPAITLIEKTREKNKLEEEIQTLKKILINNYQPEDYTNQTHQGYKITYTQPTTRTTINTSKLKQDHPEIAAKYQTQTQTQPIIRIIKTNNDSKNQTENDPHLEQ